MNLCRQEEFINLMELKLNCQEIPTTTNKSERIYKIHNNNYVS